MLIALGIMTGILGFLPLFLSLRLSRRSTSTHALTIGLYGLAGVAISCHTCRGAYRLRDAYTRRLVGFVVARRHRVFGLHHCVRRVQERRARQAQSAFKLN